MTRTPRPCAPSYRRLAVGTAAVVTTLGVAFAAPLPAQAASATPSTTSTAIAAEATQALDALARWETTGSVGDYTSYLRARSQAAKSTATELGVPADDLKDAWGDVSVDKQHVVLSAISQLGVPYRSRMSQEGRGFDCSGLVLFAYSEAGIELPRSSGDQIRAATEVGTVRRRARRPRVLPGSHQPLPGCRPDGPLAAVGARRRSAPPVRPLVAVRRGRPRHPGRLRRLTRLVNRTAAVTK